MLVEHRGSAEHRARSDALEPPRGALATVRHLGPGIIITGSIVGSGELILTTHLGAEAGFGFLWLLIAGCILKVFVQIELGRHTIASGETSLEAFDHVPGPRWRASWVVWWWAAMVTASFLQVGGIVGGVGQALDIAIPLGRIQVGRLTIEPVSAWTVLVCISGMALLYRGRYRLVEAVTTALVFIFTAVTILCVILLQWTPYAVRSDQLIEGFLFRIPATGVATAFAAFGITGVGASELIYYPYWCLEKGYARYAGPSAESEEWARRARGWIRVLKIDAWLSLAVYTTATIAFYLLGAAVLHARGEVPSDSRLIAILSNMYVHTIGRAGMTLFLVGALAVLYSTFFVATASNARVIADFFGVAGFADYGAPGRRSRWVSTLCLILPVLYAASYLLTLKPVALVKAGAVMQALTLPFIAGATLYLRYRRTDRRLSPTRVSDAFLWLAAAGMAIVSLYQVGAFIVPAR